jgi:hypothetical protein
MVISNESYHSAFFKLAIFQRLAKGQGLRYPLGTFLWFILYSPFAVTKLVFPIFLISDLHNIEFLQIVVIFYYADAAHALKHNAVKRFVKFQWRTGVLNVL